MKEPTACVGINHLELFTLPCGNWDLENSSDAGALATAITMNNKVPQSPSMTLGQADWLACKWSEISDPSQFLTRGKGKL